MCFLQIFTTFCFKSRRNLSNMIGQLEKAIETISKSQQNSKNVVKIHVKSIVLSTAFNRIGSAYNLV